MLKSSKFWLGLAISLVLIIWALSQVDLSQLGQALARTNYLYLLACLPILWGQYVLRALRWDYLLRPITKVGYPSLLTSTVLGFTANLLLPARLGEIVRAVDLGRREKISKTAALATVVMERVLDGLVVVPTFLVSAWALNVFGGGSETAAHTQTAALVFGGVYLAVLAVVAGLSYNPEKALGLVRFVLSPLSARLAERLASVFAKAVEGLSLLRYPRLVVPAVAYSLVIWLVMPVPLYIMAQGVGHPVSYTAALFVNGLICLAISVPSAPGYIGTLHYAIQVGFGVLLGMSQERALALGIIFHGATFVFTILYCLSFLIRGKVSLPELNRATKLAQGEENGSAGGQG